MKKKEKNPVTLRLLLYIIFSVSVLIPVICFIVVIPSFFRNELNTQQMNDVESKLVSVSNELLNTIFSLQQISIIPYSDNEIYNMLTGEGDGSFVDISQEIPVFKYMKILYNDITSITIIGENNNIYYYHRNQNNKIIENYDFSKFKNLEPNHSFYVGSHMQEYFEKKNPNVFSFVKVMQHPYKNEPLYTIIIDSESSFFNQVFASMNMNENTTSVLLDANNNVIYSSKDISSKTLDSLKEGRDMITIGDENNKVVYHKIEIGNWTIAVIVSTASTEKRIGLIYFVCFFSSLITIIFTFSILRIISIKYMLRPLSEMAHVMKEVEKGNLNIHFSSNSRDEISMLGRKLNRMIEELQLLIDKEYKLAISQKQAEYKALQARIKPHFLYNSLNCIVGLNRMGDRKRLEEAILDLTDMMRYTLSSNSKNGWSTVDEEVEFIRQYIHLEKLRFEDKLQFEMEYDSNTKDLRIPKLLIQPLLENSIIHNVEKSLDPVLVKLTIKLIENSNTLMIIAEDKGIGFDTTTSEMGIGLSNVRERLDYGFSGAQMFVDSIIGKGTNIKILIPINEVKNEIINS
jgi:two-component system sensor histidine kinase YesM